MQLLTYNHNVLSIFAHRPNITVYFFVKNCLSGSDELPMRTCLWQRISISVQKRRRNTRKSAWCRILIAISWMWNVQDAIKSPQSLAMYKHSSFVCWLLCCPLPAYKRKSKVYRRMLLEAEAALKVSCIKMNVKPSQ